VHLEFKKGHLASAISDGIKNKSLVSDYIINKGSGSSFSICIQERVSVRAMHWTIGS
jgi:hypothetical protein